jgi:hypothetical protein
MNVLDCEFYWHEIPIGKENAVTYDDLREMWNKDKREVRRILHNLSAFDNGDNYVLIRSGKTRGFYRTDDHAEIAAYRKECLNKGRSIFAPVKKCNRVLNDGGGQLEIFNNLRAVREALGMKQKTVCERMKEFDRAFDVSLLSKMENGVCLPTYAQTAHLAEIYGVQASELIGVDLYELDLFDAI